MKVPLNRRIDIGLFSTLEYLLSALVCVIEDPMISSVAAIRAR